MSGDGKKIGQLLLEAGLITDAQLQSALESQRAEGGRVCFHLIRQGFLAADALLEFLRGQFGVAAVNISNYVIPFAVLSLVTGDIARRHRVIPVSLIDRVLALAMENPKDIEAVAAVEKHTGLTVDPLISPQAVIEEALDRYYPLDDAARPARAERRIFSLDDRNIPAAVFDTRETAGGLHPADWLRRVIFLAIKKRSREIHLEPREDGVRVRYRTGVMLINGETIPGNLGPPMAGILLDYSGLDSRVPGTRPREGWITVRVKERDLKVVFSTFPVIHGDRVILKLVDESHLRRPLGEQGLEKAAADRIRLALEQRGGVYMVSSPAAQQRNWALYHLIELLKTDDLNVITVEPYVLYPLPGVNQTLYSGREGNRQRDAVEAALRQEPDVIGIADLEEQGVIEEAVVSAPRSLIIGTLAAAHSCETIQWLRAARSGSMALAHLFIGTLALRFIPRLCPHCRRPYTGRVDIIEGTRDLKPEEMTFFESPGCSRCEKTGRSGHLGLFESFILDDDLRDLFAEGAPPKVIYEEAQRRGMLTLLEDGLRKASRGEVDVRDVLRVVPSSSDTPG
jgi:type IV pilus assembly protein PilB